MSRVVISVILLICLGFPVLAQRPLEVGVVTGGTFYNGDLGTFFQTGAGPAFGISSTYNFPLPVGVRASINYGIINASDKKHPARQLKFRSPVFEYSIQVHYYFTRMKTKSRNFSVKFSKRNYRKNNFAVISYVFVGLGNCYYNPKGKYTDGTWYDLQPLATEGQGIIPTRDPYKLHSMIIPFGAGARLPIRQGVYLGFELSFRKTFTDYLDDVSLSYVNTTVLNTQMGPESAYFSDPSQNPELTQTYPAVARGNPKNRDMYLFCLATLSYDFPQVKKRTKFKI